MTSLIIQTQDHLTDSPQSKTITNINPAVKTADLLTFAQMTAALSSDSYVKAERLIKTELDSDSRLPFPTNFSLDPYWDATQGKTTQFMITDTPNPIPFSLKSFLGSSMSFQFRFYGGNSETNRSQHSEPYAVALSSTGPSPWSETTRSHSAPNSYAGCWNLALYCPNKEECDLTVTVRFDENNTFQGWEKTFVLHFFNEE